jgi:hypothetical protein
MNVLDEQVRHRQFGIGTVTGQSATEITVCFSQCGTKKFLYPSVFQSFLTLENDAASSKLKAELQLAQEKTETERRQREDAELIKREDERRALLKKKRTAKRTPPAKRSMRKASCERTEAETDDEL